MRLALFIALLMAALAGCGGDKHATPFEQVIPPIPANTDFGALYPRLNETLNGPRANVFEAVELTRTWAETHLDQFREASCARTQVIYDAEFASLFGRKTLGVTLPWMQIYIRDGRRSDDSSLWSDASLFVSTVLHEYVHAIQRKRQATASFGLDGSCEAARNTLTRRRGQWNSGFSILQSSLTLGQGFDQAERTLLYHWVSPIERARDEVEAATMTVRWMNQFPNELNLMTVGGANNWAYGVLYLNHLKNLATSNCFSSDDATYQEELKIYHEQIPVFVAELAPHEPAMRAFLNQAGLPSMELNLTDYITSPEPTGRTGHACQQMSAQLPHFPITHTEHQYFLHDAAIFSGTE